MRPPLRYPADTVFPSPRSRLLDGKARASYAKSEFCYEARATGGNSVAVELEKAVS